MECLALHRFFPIISYTAKVKIPAPLLCFLVIAFKQSTHQQKALLSCSIASPFPHIPMCIYTHTGSPKNQRHSAHSKQGAFYKAKPQVVWIVHCFCSSSPWTSSVESHRNNAHSTSVRRKGGISGNNRGIWEDNVCSIKGISHRMQTRELHYSRSYFINLIEFIKPFFHLLLSLFRSHRAGIFIYHLDKQRCNTTYGDGNAANQPSKKHLNHCVRQHKTSQSPFK